MYETKKTVSDNDVLPKPEEIKQRLHFTVPGIGSHDYRCLEIGNEAK